MAKNSEKIDLSGLPLIGELVPALSFDPATLEVTIPGEDQPIRLGDGQTTTWRSVQKSFGPVHIERIGLSKGAGEDSVIQVPIAATLDIAPLTIDLAGLRFEIPTQAGSPSPKLDGLGVAYSGDGVEISGLLLRDSSAGLAFTGEAVLKAEEFAVSAVGSYAKTGGDVSLFFFGAYDGVLGGPVFFFVTGLAAGFAYNRALKLPEADEVAEFPLVRLASSEAPEDPVAALQELGDWVPVEVGEYWLAAGVRFTSFDLIHSTALVTVELGNELAIGILGRSWMSLPPPPSPEGDAPAVRYAYAELGIEIKVLPSQGLISASAILSPNSYVLSPACKVRGGFAFDIWFGDNPNAGQWVLTLGGYHPDFKVPDYYPKVPRLGFDWQESPLVTVSGDSYFALTPSAVMAGGDLEVLFHAGPLKAWLDAKMDVLVEWAPFYFEAELGVSVGASFRLHVAFISITLKVELGADLLLWGPETGGQVHVDWAVISFTIHFGADPRDRAVPLEWSNREGTGFADTLLPGGTSGGASPVSTISAAVAPRAGLYTIEALGGLLRTFQNKDGQSVWVVRPDTFDFRVASAIPATAVKHQDQGLYKGISTVNIRPMRTNLTASELNIRYSSIDDQKDLALGEHFDLSPLKRPLPAAKWGPPLAGGAPECNEIVKDCLLGIEATPLATELAPQNLQNIGFGYDTVSSPADLPLAAAQTPAGAAPRVDPQSPATITGSIMSPAVVQARSAIFSASKSNGVDPGGNGSLTKFQSAPDSVLTGNPLLA